MFLNKSDYCNTPKYLSNSFHPSHDSSQNPLSHKHAFSSVSNKENAAFRENVAEKPEFLLDNLFKKLNYFSNSSASFLKSAEKLSKHVIKEPIGERKFKDYTSEKRKMENSLEIIVIFNKILRRK